MSGMEHNMDRQQFQRLIAAYGGDADRWPEASRDMAFSFAGTAEGRAMIAFASALDAALMRYKTSYPSSALHAQILATGASQIASRRWLRRLTLGATMIGVSLAGGLAGAAVMMAAAPPPAFMTTESATAFGDLQPDLMREAQ